MALENALFDPMLDAGAALAVTASLHTATPDSTGSSEIAGGAYARQSLSWAAATGGSVGTSASFTFNVPASTTVTHVGLWGDTGTWLGSAMLSAEETFSSAGTLTVAPLTVSLSNAS